MHKDLVVPNRFWFSLLLKYFISISVEDTFQRNSPSAAKLVTVLKRNTDLARLYNFPPTHDAFHSSFQEFTTLLQSHIPHPDPALLWLCCKSTPAVPQRPNPMLSSPCSWGCHDRVCPFGFPFAYCLQEKCPSTAIHEAQVMLAP